MMDQISIMLNFCLSSWNDYYYINTFNLSAADLLYGTDWGSSDLSTGFGEFKGALGMQMYVELSDDALQLSKFGFDPGDEFTGYVHISTFHSAASAYFAAAALASLLLPVFLNTNKYSLRSVLCSCAMSGGQLLHR